jgi:hypothetical protein
LDEGGDSKCTKCSIFWEYILIISILYLFIN